MNQIKCLRKFGAVIAAALVIQNLSAGEEPPSLSSDKPEFNDVIDGGTATFTASGGSTEEPPADRGCPPWTKTANRQYTWHVTVVEAGEEGDIDADPVDGTVTTSETLTLTIEKPGKVEVSVALQEEWEDSSEEPQKLFWPEAE